MPFNSLGPENPLHYTVNMVVSTEYAQAHLEQLLAAAEIGEQVEIARPDKPLVRLALATSAPKRKLWGAAKGQIWIADDFNSPQVSEEIADLFEK